MKLPETKSALTLWSFPSANAWDALLTKTSRMEAAAGQNSAFAEMLAKLRNMAMSGRFEELPALLKRRLTARALSWFWLTDDRFAERLLSRQLLSTLLNAQQPRLTRITLQQLMQLYFRRFDLLDQHDGFREVLEQALLSQLAKLPESRIASLRPNPLVILKQEGKRLLTLDGPRQLAEETLKAGRELGATFNDLGLQGLDDGRYGDVCRAHFYLETLRHLPLDNWSSVMDELLKPSVSKAPFEAGRCIGHAALEILIDRSGQEASEPWQSFILDLAGDPRIASSAYNYRQWWQPLGEVRIQKVRGWLSKEDLRLFLQAVEQYGLESRNTELQRMFPARKLFLEGLFKLNLIRNTRLLLGNKAQQIVKSILGQEVKTSFATMDGPMNDKAVIYLDCGDFCLVEGSHSFKIWVYLAPPSDLLTSYEKPAFSHSTLTSAIPAHYRKQYGNLPLESFVHTPHIWQHKVFTFLAKNGIGLDIEQLLSNQDYQNQLRRFGIPVVSANRTVVPIPQAPNVNSAQGVEFNPSKKTINRSLQADQLTALSPNDSKETTIGTPIANAGSSQYSPHKTEEVKKLSEKMLSSLKKSLKSSDNMTDPVKRSTLETLNTMELRVLKYFAENPGDKAMHKAALALALEIVDIKKLLAGTLADLCWQDTHNGWHLTSAAIKAMAALEEQKANDTKAFDTKLSTSHGSVDTDSVVDREDLTVEKTSSKVDSDTGAKIDYRNPKPMTIPNQYPLVGRLKPRELKLLEYFAANSGDKARHAANVLGMSVKEVNQLLYGPLAKLCGQNSEYGWYLKSSASEELANYKEHQRGL
ncbi:EH signature domain-containing protein [Shewanella xiamenensis]|uniref:EH signature domain-containing protein n=1 Tax=Shewanella xiamenensis TaxID=332186 RepID=UPI0035BAF23B